MLPDYEIKRATTTRQKIDSIIFFIWMLLLLQMFLFLLFQEENNAEGLRFRLIANSNTTADQLVKNEVKQAIEPILMKYNNSQRQMYVELEQAVDKLSEKLNEDINISKGQALFPPKEWNSGVTSQALVDSIVIKIGNGRGDNWWCSLFPKACFKEEVEEKPKFWVWEWLKKKFST